MTMLNAKNCSNLAEREGFEPSVPVTQYARLAIYFRPANTRTLARLLETENPCGSAICRIRARREVSHRVSPDLVQSGKFSPPCAHPARFSDKPQERVL
jgi:hypothetical protein